MGKSIEEYNKEIEELKSKNENTVVLLDRQASILLDKSIEFLKIRIKNEIETCVKDNPNHTRELADQGKLKDTKQAMNQLLEEAPRYIILAMNEDNVFIHKTIKPNKNKQSYECRRMVENKYKETYQTVIGLAGKILNTYGYIKVGSDYSGHSKWQFISGSGGKIKYGYGIDVRLVENDWKEYMDALIGYYDDLLKYQSLIEEKEKTEAIDLWESI